MDEVFGRNLRALRVSKGLSQERVCEIAGISRPTLVKAEQGRRPRRLFLKAIADALGVSYDDLENAEGLRLVRRADVESAS
jgi:transcriptional regulator with XRE-family HTH domain